VRTREIALSAVFSALYATLVVSLSPISFGPLQLRIADAIIPLAMVFGWPVVAGVTLGCFVGNVYGQLGLLDYVLGPAANLITATLVYKLRQRPLLACCVAPLPIGLIVGGYLWIFFPPPEFLALPMWLVMIVSVTLSTYVAVSIVGFLLYKSVYRILGYKKTI
jgi:uncharacterized membrane protein